MNHVSLYLSAHVAFASMCFSIGKVCDQVCVENHVPFDPVDSVENRSQYSVLKHSLICGLKCFDLSPNRFSA